MRMRCISVPDYVAERFEKPLGHPNPAPDAVDRSLKRVYKLVACTLADLEGVQWDVNNGQYRSKYYVEPYGFHRVKDLFYIYGEERGRKSPIAVFKDDHMAAKYFVWLVSEGKRAIDWSLHLEMEP